MFQLLFALAAFAFVGIKIYSAFAKDVVGFRKPVRVRVPDHEISNHLQQINFYRDLNPVDQREFLERIQWFIANKDFQGMEGLQMTNEIRTIVAASAIQITFRLPLWKFPSFQTFRIHPESFYSRMLRKYLKGGAGHTGQVWFSLKDYREGFADPDNGINLGLHEMAHALVVEMQNGKLDHEFTHAFERIEALAKDRIPKIKNKQFTYLRAYAGTNDMEFIAVTTEYFFEQPDKLRAADPELYEAFSELYRQNLLAASSPNRVTPLVHEAEEEEKVKRNYRFSNWHWSLTLVLIGIFIAPVFLIFLMQNVALSAGAGWLVALGVFAVSGYVLYKPIVKSGALGATQFWLCHFFGLWPLILSAFFLINNYIPVWQHGEVHEVKYVSWYSKTSALVFFTDDALSDDKNARWVYGFNTNDLKSGDLVVVVTQYGPFGVPVYGTNLLVSRKR